MGLKEAVKAVRHSKDIQNQGFDLNKLYKSEQAFAKSRSRLSSLDRDEFYKIRNNAMKLGGQGKKTVAQQIKELEARVKRLEKKLK